MGKQDKNPFVYSAFSSLNTHFNSCRHGLPSTVLLIRRRCRFPSQTNSHASTFGDIGEATDYTEVYAYQQDCVPQGPRIFLQFHTVPELNG